MNIKKFLTIIVLMCFSFSFIFSDALHAALELKEESVAAQQFSQMPANAIIPTSCGRITEGASFGGRQLIVNIQDLHCHPEVQHNIAKILSALDKEYGLKKVYVEGGYGDIDTSWLCNIGDTGLKKEILENLVDQGKLTGTESFSVTANRPGVLKGLEDETLHKANIVRLGKILDRQELYKSRIKELDKDLTFMEARYFSARTRRFNTLVAAYSAGKMETGKYYRLLAQYLRDLDERPDRYNTIYSISKEDYPGINAFLELQERARHIRYRQLSRQMQAYIQSLKSRLPYSEYNLLLKRTCNFTNSDELCRLLAETARIHHLDISSAYPDLENFLEYTDKSRELNPLRLLADEKRLVREIRLGLAGNTAELEVSFLADFYAYFQDYLLNRLTADDYEYFNAKFDKFRSVWGKYAFKNRVEELSADFPLLSGFYAANSERNYCFLKNMGIIGDGADQRASAAMPDENTGGSAVDLLGKAELVVVVTGGFHTAGLQKLLKEKNISYITITPNVTQNTRFSSEVYTKLAKFQAKIFANALALGLASQLSSPELFKLAIAAANRELERAGITAQQRQVLLEKIAKAAGLEIVSDENGIVTFNNKAQISLKEIEGILKAEKVEGAPAGQAVKESVDKALKAALSSLKSVKTLNDAVANALAGDIDPFITLMVTFAAKNNLLTNNALIYDIEQDPQLNKKEKINKITAELFARFPDAVQKAGAQRERFEQSLKETLHERNDWLQILLAIDLLRDYIATAVALPERAKESDSSEERIEDDGSVASKATIQDILLVGSELFLRFRTSNGLIPLFVRHLREQVSKLSRREDDTASREQPGYKQLIQGEAERLADAIGIPQQERAAFIQQISRAVTITRRETLVAVVEALHAVVPALISTTALFLIFNLSPLTGFLLLAVLSMVFMELQDQGAHGFFSWPVKRAIIYDDGNFTPAELQAKVYHQLAHIGLPRQWKGAAYVASFYEALRDVELGKQIPGTDTANYVRRAINEYPVDELSEFFKYTAQSNFEELTNRLFDPVRVETSYGRLYGYFMAFVTLELLEGDTEKAYTVGAALAQGVRFEAALRQAGWQGQGFRPERNIPAKPDRVYYERIVREEAERMADAVGLDGNKREKLIRKLISSTVVADNQWKYLLLVFLETFATIAVLESPIPVILSLAYGQSSPVEIAEAIVGLLASWPFFVVSALLTLYYFIIAGGFKSKLLGKIVVRSHTSENIDRYFIFHEMAHIALPHQWSSQGTAMASFYTGVRNVELGGRLRSRPYVEFVDRAMKENSPGELQAVIKGKAVSLQKMTFLNRLKIVEPDYAYFYGEGLAYAAVQLLDSDTEKAYKVGLLMSNGISFIDALRQVGWQEDDAEKAKSGKNAENGTGSDSSSFSAVNIERREMLQADGIGLEVISSDLAKEIINRFPGKEGDDIIFTSETGPVQAGETRALQSKANAINRTVPNNTVIVTDNTTNDFGRPDPRKMKFLSVATIGGSNKKEFWLDEHGKLWIFKLNHSVSDRPLGAETYYEFVKRYFDYPGEVYAITLKDRNGNDRAGTVERVLLGDEKKSINWEEFDTSEKINEAFAEYAIPNLQNQKIDIDKLTDKQIKQFLQEMVIDWLFSNHDAIAGNFMIDHQGNIIGIDKEMVFYTFPKDGLYRNYVGTAFLYYKVVKHLASQGKLSIDLIEDTIGTIRNIPEKDFRALMKPFAEEYVKHKTKNNVYKNADEFIDAVVARKNNLKIDFADFFKRIENDRIKKGEKNSSVKNSENNGAGSVFHIFSAVSIVLREFMQVVGLDLNDPSIDLATGIIERFTGKEREDIVLTSASGTVKSKEPLTTLQGKADDLNGRLVKYSGISKTEVVVTRGNNTFAKYGDRIAGIPAVLHGSEDGTLTLYIHQEFIKALYAEKDWRAKEGMAALPRGDIIEQFIGEEVDELAAIRNLQETEKLTPIEAYVKHHQRPADQPPVHHALITTLAEQAAKNILGFGNGYPFPESSSTGRIVTVKKIEDALKRGMNQEDYNALSEEEKEYLRKLFAEALKDNVSSETYRKLNLPTTYPLVDDNAMRELIKTAGNLTRQYRNDRVYSLGQSPYWIVEAARIIGGNDSDAEYGHIAFSGGWNPAKDPGPDQAQIELYRNYLMRLGLDPRAIVKQSKANKQTVIAEVTLSGDSLKAFLSVLFNWSRDLISKELMPEDDDRILRKAIRLHIFQPDDNNDYGVSKVIEKIDPLLVFGLTNSDRFNDRGVPYFPYWEWDQNSDETTNDKEMSNSALVRFRIIDWLETHPDGNLDNKSIQSLVDDLEEALSIPEIGLGLGKPNAEALRQILKNNHDYIDEIKSDVERISRAASIDEKIDSIMQLLTKLDQIMPLRPLLDVPINKENAEEWIDSQPSKDRELAKALVDRLEYIQQDEFESELEKTIEDFNKEMQGKPYILFIPALKGDRSENWVFKIAKEKGLYPPARIIRFYQADDYSMELQRSYTRTYFYYDDTPNEVYSNVNIMFQELRIYDIAFIDDAAYSAKQLFERMADIGPFRLNKGMNVHFIIPFLSVIAEERLTKEIKTEYAWIDNTYLYHHLTLWILKDILKGINLKYKSVLAESIRHSLHFALIHFQHKLPDDSSIPWEVLKGAVYEDGGKGRERRPFIPDYIPPYDQYYLSTIRAKLYGYFEKNSPEPSLRKKESSGFPSAKPSSEGKGKGSYSSLSAVSLALQEFLRAIGLDLDDPSVDLATGIIERFTGKKKEDIVLTSETGSVQPKEPLTTLQGKADDLNERLVKYSGTTKTEVVVTGGNNTFVKYGNRIAGIPALLHRSEDGTLTLYIHQEFINALYAENDWRAKEGMAALPRGDIIEQFIGEEVDELSEIKTLQATEKLTPIQAYFKHHLHTAGQPPAHHPLITTLAEKTGITVLGLKYYQPTVLRPGSILFPGDGTPVIAQDTFKPRYFTDEITQKVLLSFAELMDHVQFVFVDKGSLSDGFTIKHHKDKEIDGTIFQNEGYARRKIKVNTTISITKDISFVQLLNLADRLYEEMLNESEGKGERYKQLLEKRRQEIEKIAKNFIYAAEYLESVTSTWPGELGITDESQAKEMREYLHAITEGFRQLTAGYSIREKDLEPEIHKAIAESWLGIDEGWWKVAKEEILREPAEKRLDALQLSFAADENSWARNIAWELAAPARELDAAVMEKGGRILDTIDDIESPYRTLFEEIDREMSGIAPDNPAYSERLINIVQKKVSKYYDYRLDSRNTKSLSNDLKIFAKALGDDPSLLASVNEISPSKIIDTKHMVCVMKGYLSGRILQQKGFSVYWLDVQESVGGEREGHVAVLAKMPAGHYRIVDAAYSEGAGNIPEEYLSQGEVEQGLSGKMIYPKTLDTGSSSLHHAVRITAFEPGARSSVYYNLGNTLSLQNRYAKAESAYRKALEINPQDASDWYNLGNALFSQNRYIEAERAYRKALEINPQYGIAWYNLGNALLYQNRNIEAGRAYRKSLEINPQDTDVWNNLGIALLSQKQYAEAERVYRKALEINHQFAGAWYNLAISLSQQNMTAAGRIAESYYFEANNDETIDIKKAFAEIDAAKSKGKNLKKGSIDTDDVDDAIRNAIRNGRAISLDLAELSRYGSEELEEALKVFDHLDDIEALLAVMNKYSIPGKHKAARRHLRKYLQSLSKNDIEQLKTNIRAVREAAIKHQEGELLDRRLVILLTEDDAFARGDALAHAGMKNNSIYVHTNLLNEVNSEPDREALGEILAHEDRDIINKGHRDDIDPSVFTALIKPLWERIRAENAGGEIKRVQTGNDSPAAEKRIARGKPPKASAAIMAGAKNAETSPGSEPPNDKGDNSGFLAKIKAVSDSISLSHIRLLASILFLSAYLSITNFLPPLGMRVSYVYLLGKGVSPWDGPVSTYSIVIVASAIGATIVDAFIQWKKQWNTGTPVDNDKAAQSSVKRDMKPATAGRWEHAVESLFSNKMKLTFLVAGSLIVGAFFNPAIASAPLDYYSYSPYKLGPLFISKFIYVLMFAPLVEEIIYRKPLSILASLTDNKTVHKAAIVMLAAVFAAIHTQYPLLSLMRLNLFVNGIFFGYLAVKYKSIEPSFLAHTYGNLLLLIASVDIRMVPVLVVWPLLAIIKGQYTLHVNKQNIAGDKKTSIPGRQERKEPLFASARAALHKMVFTRPALLANNELTSGGMLRSGWHLGQQLSKLTRVKYGRGKDKTVSIDRSDPRMLAQAYDEGLISDGMVNVVHIVRPAELAGAMEKFRNEDDITHVWFTDLTKDAPADLEPVDIKVYVGSRLVNVWQAVKNGATVYYVDLQGAGIFNEDTSSQLSQAAAEISSHFAGTDNVPGVREGLTLDMVVDHTDRPANVIAPFIGMNITKPAFVPVAELTGRDLEVNPAIRRRLIGHAAMQSDLRANKILKIDDITIDRRTGERIDPFEEFIRSLNVFRAAGTGQLLVDWSILQRAREEGRLTDKKLHEMLMLARYNSDDKRVPVHVALTVTDRTTAAEIRKLYAQGFASVGLDLKDVSPDNARQLVEGLKDQTLLYVVNAPAGSALADVPVMVKPETVAGQADRNIVVDAELPQNLDHNALVAYLEKLPREGTVIFHHRDVKELVDAARDITDQKALIAFLNILVNLGVPRITTPEQAAQRGYSWPVKSLPVLEQAQLAALMRGDMDAASLGVHSAIREQADEIRDGKVRTAFLQAIVANMLVRDRLMLKQRELGEAFVKGTYRIEHDQMRMLADLLTREFTMTKADLEKDQRDAAVLQKEIDAAADDSPILGLRSSIADNKPRPGAVTVVIDLTLQDIIVDYNLRQAAKKKQEHFSTEGMRHLLAAA